MCYQHFCEKIVEATGGPIDFAAAWSAGDLADAKLSTFSKLEEEQCRTLEECRGAPAGWQGVGTVECIAGIYDPWRFLTAKASSRGRFEVSFGGSHGDKKHVTTCSVQEEPELERSPQRFASSADSQRVWPCFVLLPQNEVDDLSMGHLGVSVGIA